MALNQSIGSKGKPVLLNDEKLIVEIKDVEFLVKFDKSGFQKGLGRFIFTSLRIILINDLGT